MSSASTRSSGTKTWNVIQFNLIKGAGLVVDALFRLFRAARYLECNLIEINKTDWVYPLGLATRPSNSVSHSKNAAVKATSHLRLIHM